LWPATLRFDPRNATPTWRAATQSSGRPENAPGCLDFAISADLIDPARINIFERWESQEAVEAFRGAGPSDEQGAAMVSASVAEYDVADTRRLT
jgi:heme-degrading monooxygenase HmoA